MLSPKVIAAVVFVWVIGAFLGGLYEMAWVGGTEQTLLNKVLFYNIVTTEGTLGSATELAGGPLGYLQAVWQMATFQFSFMTGEYELVRWIVFVPLTAYLVYGLVMTVVGILRGTLGT